MSEYIEREALLDDIQAAVDNGGMGGMVAGALKRYVKRVPAADVAPVRHGKWVLGSVELGYLTPGGNRPWICTECKQVVSWSLGRPYEKYCPNCGARMDGGAEHETD